MNLRKLLLTAALMLAAPWSLAAQEEPSNAAQDAAVQAEREPSEDASAASGEDSRPQVEAESANEASPPAQKESESDEPLLPPLGVTYPEDRPEWVESLPTKEMTQAQGRIDRIAVSSGPHYSQGEARRQLEEAIEAAAADYVNHHLGANNAARYITYDVTRVATYEERPEFSTVGPMYQSHALLQFDEAFRRQIEQDWKEALTLSRLVKTGLSVAAVFVLLSVVFGYLKADNATRGYYTRRLRFGAATMILALAAAIYFAVRWIPWI